MLKILPIIVLLTIVPGLAFAGVSMLTGATGKVVPPAGFCPGCDVSDPTTMGVYQEFHSNTLVAPFPVDVELSMVPGVGGFPLVVTDDTLFFSTFGLITGCVDGYLLHADGVGAPLGYSGSVTFTHPIVGISSDDLSLNFGDPLSGLGVVNPTGFPTRGTEMPFFDPSQDAWVWIDAFTVSFSGLVDPGDVDQIRVYTMPQSPGSCTPGGIPGINPVNGNGNGNGDDEDFGDAPDTYSTLEASGGPKHTVPGNLILFLGAQIDTEGDGQPTADATGDDVNGLDDEDGVVFTSMLTPASMATVAVTASVNTGQLNAWVDFNFDGVFTDGGNEKIFTDVALNAGVNNLVFPVPGDAELENTFARFRLNTVGGLAPTGAATDGEVEDYQVLIKMVKARGVGGDYFTLDTTAMLLAGVQTNLAWLIPVLSAVGIGAFLIRKKF